MTRGFQDILFTVQGFDIVIPAFAQQLLLAIFFGIAIGMEREFRDKPASLRTFTIISIGSCLFTMLSVGAITGEPSGPYDQTRIAAQIVSGIGFIGGGVIFKTTDRIEGITTAALIWFVAALGMACGFNAIYQAIWAFALGCSVHFFSIPLYKLVDLADAQKDNDKLETAKKKAKPKK